MSSENPTRRTFFGLLGGILIAPLALLRGSTAKHDKWKNYIFEYSTKAKDELRMKLEAAYEKHDFQPPLEKVNWDDYRLPGDFEEQVYLHHGHLRHKPDQPNAMEIVNREGEGILWISPETGEVVGSVSEAIAYFKQTGDPPSSMFWLRALQRATPKAIGLAPEVIKFKDKVIMRCPPLDSHQ